MKLSDQAYTNVPAGDGQHIWSYLPGKPELLLRDLSGHGVPIAAAGAKRWLSVRPLPHGQALGVAESDTGPRNALYQLNVGTGKPSAEFIDYLGDFGALQVETDTGRWIVTSTSRNPSVTALFMPYDAQGRTKAVTFDGLFIPMTIGSRFDTYAPLHGGRLLIDIATEGARRNPCQKAASRCLLVLQPGGAVVSLGIDVASDRATLPAGDSRHVWLVSKNQRSAPVLFDADEIEAGHSPAVSGSRIALGAESAISPGPGSTAWTFERAFSGEFMNASRLAPTKSGDGGLEQKPLPALTRVPISGVVPLDARDAIAFEDDIADCAVRYVSETSVGRPTYYGPHCPLTNRPPEAERDELDGSLRTSYSGYRVFLLNDHFFALDGDDVFTVDKRTRVVRRIGTDGSTGSRAGQNTFWVWARAPLGQSSGLFLYDLAGDAVLNTVRPLFGQSRLSFDRDEAPSATAFGLDLRLGPRAIASIPGLGTFLLDPRPDSLPISVGFGLTSFWLTSPHNSRLRNVPFDFRGQSPEIQVGHWPFNPETRVAVDITWGTVGKRLHLESGDLSQTARSRNLLRSDDSVDPPAERDALVVLTLTDLYGSHVTATWDKVRFVHPAVPLLDRKWVRTLIVFSAILILIAAFARLRGFWQRWMPGLVYAIGLGAPPVALDNWIEPELLAALLVGTALLALLTLPVSPRLFRELEPVQPFRSLAPFVIGVPRVRRRLFAPYLQLLESNLARSRTPPARAGPVSRPAWPAATR